MDFVIQEIRVGQIHSRPTRAKIRPCRTCPTRLTRFRRLWMQCHSI